MAKKKGLYRFCIDITDFAQKVIGQIGLVEIELADDNVKKNEF